MSLLNFSVDNEKIDYSWMDKVKVLYEENFMWLNEEMLWELSFSYQCLHFRNFESNEGMDFDIEIKKLFTKPSIFKVRYKEKNKIFSPENIIFHIFCKLYNCLFIFKIRKKFENLHWNWN